MLRKFITLCLFTVTVPLAVFGQDVFGPEQVKNLGAYAGEYVRKQWPSAQDNLKENIPKAARNLGHAWGELSVRNRQNVDYKEERPARHHTDSRSI
jgi:hypothetical protein